MISSDTPLVLGSASPRRREILGGLGIPLRVAPAHIPEEVAQGAAPLAYLERIVAEKLRAVARGASVEQSAGLLVADTIVVISRQQAARLRARASARARTFRERSRAPTTPAAARSRAG